MRLKWAWRYTSPTRRSCLLWGTSSKPWQAVANGSLTLKIIEAAKRLLDAARRTPTEG